MFRRSFLCFMLCILCYPKIAAQNVDIDLLRDINLNRNQSLDGGFQFLSNSAAPISVGLPIGMFGLGLVSGDSVLIRKSIVVGTSVVTATILTTLLKKSVQRSRPFDTYPDIQKRSAGGSYSFPSGHTSGAFSLATSMSLEYPKWYVIVPSYAWASAVAYSRMDLGVHYPSDVLAGALLGAGSAWLCHYVNQKVFKTLPVKLW